MASNWTVCGVCDFRNIQNSSVVWCSECDEGLCDQCKEHHGAVKSSRNHSVISVTEYQKLPLNVLEITQTCQKHKEQYQTFCKKHDCPCCRRCVIETHNECKDLTAIDDMVHNIKSSNAFLEIQKQVSELLENIKRVRNDRHKNLEYLKEERDMIVHDIEQTRKKINDYLDQLQENLIKELYVTEDNECKKIKHFMSTIEKNERDITDLQVNLTNIKQHASDLQAFLVLKHIEKVVSDKEEFIQSVVKSEDVKTKTLSFVVNEKVKNFARIEIFGSVAVNSKSCEVVVTGNRTQQAQMTVPITVSECINNIKLKNKMEINLQSGLIRGCALLPNGKMMFCFNDVKEIVALNSNGTYDFEIKLHIQPCDMAYIEAEHAVVVTSGNSSEMVNHIIDLTNRSINKSMKVTSRSYGIAIRNNAIVYCEQGTGIIEMQLNDKSKKTLVSSRMASFSYVAVHEDKMYYTNRNDHTVACYDIHGNLKWEFKDIKNIKYPQGISVDGNGNLYVAVKDYNCVVVMSPDGKQCRKILSASDGLKNPRALHFERTTNKLLVANEGNCAFLYDVD
ncbi:unnamed protein product [Mytilus coruscus]|uniref:B box-type domain-containing protein n=1 Tax=Mytilus coruscus TaxID=42192 RepID=A0A6J8AWI2_MYTCO|nr:unnamed protein product [Mytilus coruscus]